MWRKEDIAIASTPITQSISATNADVTANKNNILEQTKINAQKNAMQQMTNTIKLNDLNKTKSVASKVGDVTGTQKAKEYSFPNLLKSNINLFT